MRGELYDALEVVLADTTHLPWDEDMLLDAVLWEIGVVPGALLGMAAEGAAGSGAAQWLRVFGHAADLRAQNVADQTELLEATGRLRVRQREDGADCEFEAFFEEDGPAAPAQAGSRVPGEVQADHREEDAQGRWPRNGGACPAA